MQIKVFNFMKFKELNHHQFQDPFKCMDADYGDIIYFLKEDGYVGVKV